MSDTILKYSLDLSKVKKEWLKDGKYLNGVVVLTPDNQYGNEAFLTQDVPKEIWEKEKDLPKKQKTSGPIVGNTKRFNKGGNANSSGQSSQSSGNQGFPEAGDDDDLPF